MKMTTHLTKLKTKAIEELKQCGDHLAKTNFWLMKDIQHTDDSTAKQARDLLHQFEVYQMIEAMTQTISQNQLDMARAELQEMEKTMEKNLGKLQQQVDEATSKVQALQDELSILRTYTEVHYLNQAMQIVLLLSDIQNLKKQQQDEIDETEKMGKAILEELEEKTQLEQEEILQKVAEEVLLHQDGLKQMVINNHVLRHEIRRQKEIIKDLEEEISELKRSVQTLRQSAGDPRETIFADVFLHRPKCTPDTEVVLRIPTEKTPLPWCPQRSERLQPKANQDSPLRCPSGLPVPAPTPRGEHVPLRTGLPSQTGASVGQSTHTGSNKNSPIQNAPPPRAVRYRLWSRRCQTGASQPRRSQPRRPSGQHRLGSARLGTARSLLGEAAKPRSVPARRGAGRGRAGGAGVRPYAGREPG
ncbi:uncharacterized protein C20orf96 homolog isoform X1 [Lagopus muta]|uniref:uncharacterized protein C20orf96 homolog isoform X1 n=1 Tax=Lagopus muta TaxID=64668 RepID=UPI00209DB07E|nr:uncharacterized protein C20orf96 homolog isoform X1 [Lagopus muta]XP_048818522.1 uncharacterized protein C20orf96 homolog isoform X1 [Lagopus muta]